MTNLPDKSARASDAVRIGPPSHDRPAVHRWYYSIGLLLLYVATFLCWRYFPSRASFVYIGIISAGLMGWGMIWARRRGYFVNRVDLAVHAYVIVDVLLEGVMYEAFRWIVGSSAAPDGFVHRFHDNHNFFFCALTFVVLIGGNRWYALRLSRAERLALDRSEVEIAREETAAVAG